MPLRSAAATAAAVPLLFEPGTKMKYSNLGIDIAAAVVETVSGMRWEDFLQRRLFGPLGMTRSGFRPSQEDLAGRIRLYRVFVLTYFTKSLSTVFLLLSIMCPIKPPITYFELP